jgi:hypothetical protein
VALRRSRVRHVYGTYTYEISGSETDEPTNTRVEVFPSLDVKITARPLKSTVNYQKHSSHNPDILLLSTTSELLPSPFRAEAEKEKERYDHAPFKTS